jgi:hypothetical protein
MPTNPANKSRYRQLATFALAALVAAGCERMSPASPSAGVGDPAAADAGAAIYEAELVLCVDEINRYRASIGRPALHRSATLEEFAATVARHDAGVREAHAYFRSTNGAGIAKAETEILWWRGFAIQQVIKKGLSQMWQVGPSGDHYAVLAGAYSEVGCGIFVTNGEVTVAQDFR